METYSGFFFFRHTAGSCRSAFDYSEDAMRVAFSDEEADATRILSSL
jgi:hypothetical protein